MVRSPGWFRAAWRRQDSGHSGSHWRASCRRPDAFGGLPVQAGPHSALREIDIPDGRARTVSPFVPHRRTESERAQRAFPPAQRHTALRWRDAAGQRGDPLLLGQKNQLGIGGGELGMVPAPVQPLPDPQVAAFEGNAAQETVAADGDVEKEPGF